MFGLGFQEILILFVVALLLFGARRLPEIGKALGNSIREFKKAVSGEENEHKSDADKKDK